MQKYEGRRGAERSVPPPVEKKEVKTNVVDQDELDYVLYLDKEYPPEMKEKKRLEQEAEEEMQATKASKMIL